MVVKSLISWLKLCIRNLRCFGFRAYALGASHIISWVWSDLKLVIHNSGTVKCPCCGWKGNEYFVFTTRSYRRSNAVCPRCGALERQRQLVEYLLERPDLEQSQMKLLDLDSLLAMSKMDVSQLGFRGDTFGAIICFHVLEHVRDDMLALKELFRVIERGGFVLLGVPVYNMQKTIEYGKRVPDESGHVRKYGRDFIQRLESAGFTVLNENDEFTNRGFFHGVKI
jgi:SAM-dependent methyltransferase